MESRPMMAGEGYHFSFWMESPPMRRLRRSAPPPPPQHGGMAAAGPGADDHLSALPDDMLLQILVRLRCARAAARTGLLSRRWLGLWARLPGLTFRGVPAGEIEAALSRVGLPTAVSLIDIRLCESASSESCKLDDSHAKSLLRAAARLSPEELVLVLPEYPMVKPGRPVDIVMPRFCRATSIELDARFLRIKPPTAGELPALETLSVSGNIVSLGALLDRCPRLRVLGVTFRRADADSLDAGLAALEAAVARGLVVSRLGVEYDRGFESQHKNRRHSIDGPRFASLLRTAARLSPQELVFTNDFFGRITADLLCFHRARSIEMNLYTVRFTQLSDGEFSALERLWLVNSSIFDLVGLFSRCPRLRVLRVTADRSQRVVTVHSASLQELHIYVCKDTACRGIDIMAPVLKKLNLVIYANTDLSVSILAPMMEKVSWRCSYKSSPLMFGFWSLWMLKVETIESYKDIEGVLTNDKEDSCAALPPIHVLSVHVDACDRLGAVMDFAHEIEKLPITKVSVLEVHIGQKGHVYGSFLLRLLGMHHIRTTIHTVKVILQWSEVTEALECVGNCPCDEPRNWRNQSISLDNLVEVEIDNFRGQARDIDFLTSIFKWAPMLRRMTVRLSSKIRQNKFKGYTMDIYNIFMAHPSVNCSLYMHSKLVQHTSIELPCS